MPEIASVTVATFAAGGFGAPILAARLPHADVANPAAATRKLRLVIAAADAASRMAR